MDESKALNKILECADLIAMLEDLSSAAARGALSASGISGIKITLRGIREQLLGAHDVFAKTLIARTRNESTAVNTTTAQTARENTNTTTQRPIDYSPGSRPANAIGQDSNAAMRRDLRAMIEKGMES